MRRRQHGLGARIELVVLIYMLVLSAGITALLVGSYRRTEATATRASRDGLEVEGRLTLAMSAALYSSIGLLQLEPVADISRQAADFLGAFRAVGGSAPAAPERLTPGPRGWLYDPAPGRRTDLVVFDPTAPADAIARDVRDSAAHDALFPALLTRAVEQARSAAFDPVAIYFISPRLVRYFPPNGFIGERPPSTAVAALMERVGPAGNPTHATIWSPPYFDTAGQGLVLTAYTAVYDGDEFRGAIGVDISLARQLDQFDLVRPTLRGFALYVDQGGELVPTRAAGPVQAALDDPASSDLRRIFGQIRAGAASTERVRLGDEDVVMAFAPFPRVGGSVILVAPVADLTRQAEQVSATIANDGRRTLRTTLAVLAVFILASLVIRSAGTRWFMLRPIGALVQGTRAVAAGDLSVTLPVRSRDELGQLARSFNAMTMQLRERRSALEEREAQYRSVFESTSDGIMILDADGLLVEANPAMTRLFGFSREELRALPPEAYQSSEGIDADIDWVRRIRAGEQARVRTRTTAKDGADLDVEVYATPFVYRGAPHALLLVRDITDQVRTEQVLEERVAERTRELTALLDVARTLTATLDLRALLGLVLDQAMQLVPSTRSGVLIEDGDVFRVLDTRGEAVGDINPSAPALVYPAVAVGELAEPLRRGEPLIIADLHGDTAIAAAFRRAQGLLFASAFTHLTSWMAVPIAAKDRFLGALTFAQPEAAFYTERHAQLAMAVANQAAIAIENARLYEQAAAAAALEERQRLARELHDSVSQALYGIALGGRTARRRLERDPENVQALAEPLDYILNLAEAGLTEMRALIFELRPESLASEGLVAALGRQADALRARHGIEVERTLVEEPDLPLAAKEALYRVAQEAMHNVVKHARATRVVLCLAWSPEGVVLDIDDDGIGFDPAGDFPGHLGLTSMRERVAAVGGDLSLTSAAGAGTRLHVVVPWPE